jgi:hypothetical protein
MIEVMQKVRSTEIEAHIIYIFRCAAPYHSFYQFFTTNILRRCRYLIAGRIKKNETEEL